MSSTATQWKRLIALAERIRQISSPYASRSRPIRLTGLRATLIIPCDEVILPLAASTHLDSRARHCVLDIARKELETLESLAQASLLSTLRRLQSVEGFGGWSDEKLEASIRSFTEATYTRYVEAIIRTVGRVVAQARSTHSEAQKKGSGFGPRANSVLETAFTSSSSLTIRECAIVAKAAGITHQQVRTWFQNKRNRGKRSVTRPTAPQSDIQYHVTEPIIPPERRVISGLPKRAAASTNLPPPPPPALSPRPVRGLPRRARHVSPSPTSSMSSVTSLESISPTGGFIPASYPEPTQTHAVTHSSLTLPYPGAEIPAFNFTPPTPFNANFNSSVEADMNLNVNDILPPWSNADFTSMLNSVLSDPTLAGSPSFTAESSADVGGTGIGSDWWTSDGLEDDFFAMLDGFISDPSSSDGGDKCLAHSPLALDTLDLPSMAPTAVEISPVDALDDSSPATGPSSTIQSSSGSSSRSDSPEPLITPTHPHTLSCSASTFLDPLSVANPISENPSVWMSGVLAFDCDGAEWQGCEEKFQPVEERWEVGCRGRNLG